MVSAVKAASVLRSRLHRFSRAASARLDRAERAAAARMGILGAVVCVHCSESMWVVALIGTRRVLLKVTAASEDEAIEQLHHQADRLGYVVEGRPR